MTDFTDSEAPVPALRPQIEPCRWTGVNVLQYKTEGSAPFKDITRQTLFDDPDLLSQSTVGCASDVTISGIAAGTYTATIELLDGATSIAIYECAATLEPGSSATLECEAQR